MEDSKFDRLLQRYVTGKVTEEERVKIEAWLKVMKAERDVDLELDKETEETLFQRIVNPGDTVEDVISLYPRRSMAARLISNRWVQIAALVVIMVSVSLGVWRAIQPAESTRALASEKEKLILNDGTLVWIQPGSRFTYYQKEDGTRWATLSGEALLEVAKIANSSFTITCGGVFVKVVGTSFNLRTDQEGIELKVLTGIVNLSSAQDTSGIDVSSQEKVIYTPTGHVDRAPLETWEASALTADTEYAMRFDNVTMEEVIERIERKFDVTVRVNDSHLKQCHVTVDLTDNSLRNTLSMLTDVLDISFTIDSNVVSLSGKGCD